MAYSSSNSDPSRPGSSGPGRFIPLPDALKYIHEATGLRWSPSKLYRLRKTGRIPTYEVAGTKVLAADDIKALSEPRRLPLSTGILDRDERTRRRRAEAARTRMGLLKDAASPFDEKSETENE